MSNIELKPIPFITSGMKYGGTPEDNVLNYMKSQAELQSYMNNKYGGNGKRNKSHKKIKSYKKNKSRVKKLTKYYRYKLKGGESSYVNVPQFPDNNLNNSPQNVNTNSVLLNKIYIDSLNNSKYDCYATNSCKTNVISGGTKYKKYKNLNTKKTKRKKIKNQKDFLNVE